MMDETDKEFRRIFEQTTTRNVRAAVAFSNDTRKLIHDLEARVERLEQQNRLLVEQLEQFRIMLAGVQAKLFSGGT